MTTPERWALEACERHATVMRPRERSTSGFGTWRVLYREGQRVVVQKQLLLLDVIGSSFDPDQPYACIRDRVSLSADGEPISEWSINFDDISRL